MSRFTASKATVLTPGVTLVGIFHKIFLSSFLWGVGTAIGELPPYFVARAGKSLGLKQVKYRLTKLR